MDRDLFGELFDFFDDVNLPLVHPDDEWAYEFVARHYGKPVSDAADEDAVTGGFWCNDTSDGV